MFGLVSLGEPDPLFKALVERQEGRDFPYPLSVEGVGPWVDGGDYGKAVEEEEAASTSRSRRRQARATRAVAAKPDAEDLRPEELDRDDGVPPEWEQVLDRQES